ncbi:MAG: prealbumin-like fold domain-containing protein [Cyclobacteriaceae bacterium]
MKTIIIILRLYVAIALILAFTQCSEELEFDENGITMVTVVDEWTGDPIPNASVKVYNHEDDWAFEENLIKTLTTNADGQVKLKELNDGDYYLDVIKDDMTNWQNPRGIQVYKGDINIDNIAIAHNFNYIISSAKGKDWKITNVYDEFDNDISDDPAHSCMIGNVAHFEKAGYYTMDDDTDRCDNLPQFREASWWGYGQNLSLLINGVDVKDYFVHTFQEDHFILIDYSGDELIKFRYEQI